MKRKLTQPEPEFPGLFQLCGEVHKEEPAQRKPSKPQPEPQPEQKELKP